MKIPAFVGPLDKEITLRMRHIEGPSVDLLSLDEVRDLPEVTRFSGNGVYFLWKEGALIYVGQSNSVANRVRMHRQNHKVRDYDLATWLSVDWPWHLSMEALYIAKLSPRMNGFADGPMSGHRSEANEP